MPSPAASNAAARNNIFRRFRRSRRGSAAVEFALVAPLFFALLFAILETAIMFFASQALESLTQNAARQVLTGQAQTQSPSITTLQNFKDFVCPKGSVQLVLFSCDQLYVDVKTYPAFQNIAINSQIDATGNFDPSTLSYSNAAPGSIVVVRLFYKWQLFVTGLGFNISNLTGNQRLLVATAAFQTEPY
jgi:Flp pilus assembly protein TadG